MFNYFGSKLSLARTYQPPRFDTIIEPFAGSAQYAVSWLTERPSMRAFVFDTDPIVIKSWQRMMDATPDEIAAWEPLPDGAEQRDYIDQANRAAGWRPRVAGRARDDFYASRHRWASTRAAIGDRIVVTHGSYRDIDTARFGDATWFVDPPYQHQGHQYTHGSAGIDYGHLAEWCRSLPGQVIVTEARPADWLPFTTHRTLNDQSNGSNTEVVWYSDPEPSLFDDIDIPAPGGGTQYGET